MSANQSKPLSYRDAGVNIDAGNKFVEKIKSSVASTNRPGVMGKRPRCFLSDIASLLL